jgi:dienelactone hydrolase
MKIRVVLLLIATVPLLTGTAHAQVATPGEPLSSDAYRAVVPFFQYDRTIPLDARVVARAETKEFIREKVVFTGGRGDRVPGILAIPKTGTAPYPIVLQIHAGASSKEGWWSDTSFERGTRLTDSLLRTGIAVLALDAQYHGERSVNNDYLSFREMYFDQMWFGRYRDMLVESTRDYLRALDYLMTRPDIDVTRIGVIGHSAGGLVTVYLTALEPRVRAAVACVAALSESWLYPLMPISFAPAIRNGAFLAMAGRADPLISAESIQRFFDQLRGSTKEPVFFDAGHQLPVEYIDRALSWFNQHLK